MGWFGIARFILRQRVPLLAVVLSLTAFMAYQASHIRLSYHGNRLIPESDPEYIAYQDFRSKFGADGNVMVVGLQSPRLTDSNQFLILTLEFPLISHARSAGAIGILSYLAPTGKLFWIKPSLPAEGS
ncbi:MAG: hypothetical protein ACKO18_04215, partial [Bacteroidota bacterium]